MKDVTKIIHLVEEFANDKSSIILPIFDEYFGIVLMYDVSFDVKDCRNLMSALK